MCVPALIGVALVYLDAMAIAGTPFAMAGLSAVSTPTDTPPVPAEITFRTASRDGWNMTSVLSLECLSAGGCVAVVSTLFVPFETRTSPEHAEVALPITTPLALGLFRFPARRGGL